MQSHLPSVIGKATCERASLDIRHYTMRDFGLATGWGCVIIKIEQLLLLFTLFTVTRVVQKEGENSSLLTFAVGKKVIAW